MKTKKLTVRTDGYRGIAWIESIAFFLLANTVMLLGSDFPPPVGFLWITLAAAVMAIVQWFTVRWLLANMGKRRTLGITLMLWVLLGMAVYAGFTALHGGVRDVIWIGITVFVFAGYWLVLWAINRGINRRLSGKSNTNPRKEVS